LEWRPTSAAQSQGSRGWHLRANRRPDITLDEMMKHVKGPDFPTGCAICGVSGVNNTRDRSWQHESARKAGVEEIKGGKEQIVITEILTIVNRATLVERSRNW